MAKYKAIKRGHSGERIVEAGEEFDFDGKPGSWMVLVDTQETVERVETPAVSVPAKRRKSK